MDYLHIDTVYDHPDELQWQMCLSHIRRGPGAAVHGTLRCTGELCWFGRCRSVTAMEIWELINGLYDSQKKPIPSEIGNFLKYRHSFERE
jgi:hypothetical protein